MCSFLHSCSCVFSIFRDKCLNFVLQGGKTKLHCVTSWSFQEVAIWICMPHSDSSPQPLDPSPHLGLVKLTLITVTLSVFKDSILKLFSSIHTQVHHKCLLDERLGPYCKMAVHSSSGDLAVQGSPRLPLGLLWVCVAEGTPRFGGLHSPMSSGGLWLEAEAGS